MRPPAALLLDLDGTLLDTEPIHVRAHREHLDTLGVAVTDAEIWGNIGKGDGEFYAGLLQRAGRAGDPVALVHGKTIRLREIYHSHGVAWRPGAPELIARSRVTGITAMVVTSSDRQTAACALAASDGGAELRLRLCAEDVARRKPDPEPYALAARRLGLPPERCWAVEDSPSGVASARAAGVGWVFAVPGHIPGERLRAAGAHDLVDSLHDIARWLA